VLQWRVKLKPGRLVRTSLMIDWYLIIRMFHISSNLNSMRWNATSKFHLLGFTVSKLLLQL
jgi:hypothetical protein